MACDYADTNNRIGRPAIGREGGGKNDDDVRIDTDHPAVYVMRRTFTAARATCTNKETQALFAGRYLEKGLPCANVLTKNLHEKECRHLLQDLERFSATTGRLKHALLSYDNGLPGMAEMARRFNMSPQTLGRRLAAEGTDYKTVSRQVREKRACDLLKTSDLSIEEIAARLGYSDTANFYRAFKSWTGKTPLGFRRKET
ncbi:MAG: helix-turn-helix transcriptional regulator [Thermodesulfobacteriota bacterium]|nr:helix-turn-helix transcriptional regulator [Thermodesulfobacteriota bacterium]